MPDSGMDKCPACDGEKDRPGEVVYVGSVRGDPRPCTDPFHGPPDLTREYHTQVIELLAAERDRLRDAAHFAIGQASAGAERSRDPYTRRLCASIADGLGAALTAPTPDTEVAARKGTA